MEKCSRSPEMLQSLLYGTSVKWHATFLAGQAVALSMMRGQCEMAFPLASVGLTVHVKTLPWSTVFASHSVKVL